MKATRARSQALDVDFSVVRLDRSPLKDARHGMRVHNDATTTTDTTTTTKNGRTGEVSVCMDSDPAVEDEILLSPKKDGGGATRPILSKKRSLEDTEDAGDGDEENTMTAKQGRPRQVSAESGKPAKRSKHSKDAANAGPGTLIAMFAKQKQRQKASGSATTSSSSVSSSTGTNGSMPTTSQIISGTQAADAPFLDLKSQTFTPSPRKVAALSVSSVPSKPGSDLQLSSLADAGNAEEVTEEDVVSTVIVRHHDFANTFY